LEVENPPLDAKDPEEWRDFFSQFDGSHVTFCTISLDNEDLVRALVQRRKLVLQIEYLLRPGVRFDKNNLDAMVQQCYPVPLWQKLFLWASDAPTLLKKIRSMEEGTIKKLAAQDQHASNVFVTFETEQGQRRALEALSVRRLDLWMNKSNIPQSLLFRGKHLLAVKEPPEPSSVRWQDLGDSNTVRLNFISVFTCSLYCTGSAYLCSYATEKDNSGSCFNICFAGCSGSRWCFDCGCTTSKCRGVRYYDLNSQSGYA
jgi:hypothetical protein